MQSAAEAVNFISYRKDTKTASCDVTGDLSRYWMLLRILSHQKPKPLKLAGF